MKKILFIILLSVSVSSESAGLKDYRETPLLCQKVEENHLPFGEYSLVRSYRNVTQLLVSVNTKIILYTDRDNRKDSEIYVSAYSRLEEVHLNVPSINQHEFNLTVEKLIRNGDSSNTSTIQFPGCGIFIEKILSGTKPDQADGEYFIYLNENGKPSALMTLNQFWKKLTLRNMLNEEKIPSAFYSIYIDECYDRNIKKIIREYSAAIKNRIK